MPSLAYQHIAERINRRAEVEAENQRMDELERKSFPLFFAVIVLIASVLLSAHSYLARQKECPMVQQGERLVFFEQLENGMVCHYALGWNMYGHNKIARVAK